MRIINGYDDGTFRPDSPVNRAEAFKIIFESLDTFSNYEYDNRDLMEYPHKGANFQIWGKRTGNNKWLHYYQCGVDIIYYLPLTRQTTLAMRSATLLSSGKIPIYDRTYFGYEERIRGWFYDIFEGEKLILGSVEYRFPLLKVRYFDIQPLPGFEAYSNQLKFGISAGIFCETGAVWFQHDKLDVDDFNSGFGAGIHFHVPYINVFRLECGFNFQWKPQLIADIETKF